MSPRRAVAELAYYLAGNGGDKFGPISLAVTEGRIRTYEALTPRSTSCGDLLHCVAFAAGCRSDAINRAEHCGWVPGVNLSRWFVPPATGRIWKPKREQFQIGDFGCYDYTTPRAHGFVFLGWEGENAVTADFGQPGGKLYKAQVREIPGGVAFRGRAVDCIVSLDAVRFDRPAQSVAEWCAARKLPDPGPWMPYEYL